MKYILAAICAACIATSGTAQEFHGGLSLDYAKPHSGDDQTGFSGIAGVVVGGPAFKYGIEAEAGLPLGGNTDYDTTRLRLIGLYDLGNYDLLGSAGFTRYSFADSTDDGSNLGLGVQRNYGERTSLRAEFIRDFLDDSFTAAVTTTRIGILYNF